MDIERSSPSPMVRSFQSTHQPWNSPQYFVDKINPTNLPTSGSAVTHRLTTEAAAGLLRTGDAEVCWRFGAEDAVMVFCSTFSLFRLTILGGDLRLLVAFSRIS
jgi:hypothetical protein